jgi:hypothetical protein
VRRDALQDFFVLADMKAALRRHLNAALIECACHARDLGTLDADDVMRDLRGQFDPESRTSPIQDCFADAFHTAGAALKDTGGDPLAARQELASGAQAPRA